MRSRWCPRSLALTAVLRVAAVVASAGHGWGERQGRSSVTAAPKQQAGGWCRVEPFTADTLLDKLVVPPNSTSSTPLQCHHLLNILPRPEPDQRGGRWVGGWAER